MDIFNFREIYKVGQKVHSCLNGCEIEEDWFTGEIVNITSLCPDGRMMRDDEIRIDIKRDDGKQGCGLGMSWYTEVDASKVPYMRIKSQVMWDMAENF